MKRKKVLKKRRSKKASVDRAWFRSMVVYSEMIKDRGEDYYLSSALDNYGIIGVFDGCGGSGSRRYAEYDNKTGAYISSRITSKAVLNWFYEFCNEDKLLSQNTIEDICIELENRIHCALSEVKSNTEAYKMKGSMLKDFPTTASLIFYTHKNENVYSAFIWCGDSRGYILQPHGLVQITRDDISVGLDALSNLKNDGQLTNVISADGKFILHGKIIECDKPAILITATDGSFGYFSTPMEFEYVLLKTLIGSANMKEWNVNLNSYLKEVSGDDYTIVISIYGFKNFNILKKTFLHRERDLYDKYLSNLKNTSESERNDLWQDYKLVYYGEAQGSSQEKNFSRKIKKTLI